MMSTDVAIAPDIELLLPARAENVAIVRHAFGALGEALAVDPQTLSDILLAVTEACTNVVVHAYPDGREGPLEVLAALLDEELTVVVRDEGPGIVPRPDSPGLGLGLPLIASLAETVQLRREESEHTEVQMTFLVGEGSLYSQLTGQPDALGQAPPAGQSATTPLSSNNGGSREDAPIPPTSS
jgi:serine/threonine-protein kinase RsbW